MEIKIKKFLILGYGYTGQVLKEKIYEQYPQANVYSTSRTQKEHIFFDLEDEESWSNLPREIDMCFWTFPAQPLNLVEKFLSLYSHQIRKIVAIGTTRAFITRIDDEVVTEDTLLDLKMERVQGENLIRKNNGIVVYASGIYGPHRNPIDWVKKGRIGKSKKFLNLIHVEDLCEILLSAAHRGREGAIYIASDGKPERWSDLIDQWEAEQEMTFPELTSSTSAKKSKNIQSLKTLNELQVQLKFPSVHSFIRP